LSDLDLSNRLEDADAFYAALVEALDAAGSDAGPRLLCRLVLILANEVGDQKRLMAALSLASVPPPQ
jgi:Protein of unknown function (DUF2783)